MSGGVLNAAMLLGLLGAAAPLVIHLLNRSREPVVDWGAMQFLELGRRDQQSLRLTELVLLLARAALPALVALALARPFWSWSSAPTFDGPERRPGAGTGTGPGLGTAPRDVVLILDGSASMGRRAGDSTAHDQAVQWARAFTSQLRPGDSAAVLWAGDRVRGLVDPPSVDHDRVAAALADVKPGRGASDLPAALVEAFRLLERTSAARRDVIVLTDGQRFAWRPDESGRWDLVRDLQRRLPIPPRLWSIPFGAEAPATANGSLGPLVVSRSLITPGLPVVVSTTLANTGAGPLTRTAELLIDDRPVPGSAQAVGPVPPGSRITLAVPASFPTTGPHLLTVRLVGGSDSLPDDDDASLPVQVGPPLPALLVDGEPSLEPLDGETDFLRAALAPSDDDAPLVLTKTVPLDAFSPEALSESNPDRPRVLVLANVEQLAPGQADAVGRFLDTGGGVLVAPGDQTDVDAFTPSTLPWLPARLGDLVGSPRAQTTAAHPDPRSFVGPALEPFARGEAPPLAEADLFAYRRLEPELGAAVVARLDSGTPWAIERPAGKGRVLLLAAPLDAEAGTLPVNPDFVPLIHEWVFQLAGGQPSRPLQPGEPWVLDLDGPADDAPQSVRVQTPEGTVLNVPVVEGPNGAAQVRFEETHDAGVYRLTRPDPPGGLAYAVVAADPRESDPARLKPAETKTLAQGWPLVFEPDPNRLTARLQADEAAGRHEAWRGLILAALGGLCLEVYLTRRLVRSRPEGGRDGD